MDRGTAALVRTRRTPTRGAAGARTGEEIPEQGVLDALHRRFELIRDRAYQAKPPLPTAKLNECRVLWDEWLLFYTNPLSRGPNGHARLYQFQQQANNWEHFLNQMDLEQSGGSSLLPYGLAAAALLGVVALATRPKSHG